MLAGNRQTYLLQTNKGEPKCEESQYGRNCTRQEVWEVIEERASEYLGPAFCGVREKAANDGPTVKFQSDAIVNWGRSRTLM